MADPRSELIATARAMQPAGLNRGTSGNVSVRHGAGFYITPTGMPYDSLRSGRKNARESPRSLATSTNQEVEV